MEAGNHQYLLYLSGFECMQFEILNTEDPKTSKAVFVIKVDKVTSIKILMFLDRQPQWSRKDFM